MTQEIEAEKPIKSYGFLVGARVKEGETTPDYVAERIHAFLSGLVGVYEPIVEILGEIEEYTDGQELDPNDTIIGRTTEDDGA